MTPTSHGWKPSAATTAKRRATFCSFSTPMQMVPEIVRSLSQANVAIYQVLLLNGDHSDP